jgi:hypothetical protein
MFKQGQYVIYNKQTYKIPDFDHYIHEKDKWDHLPFYGNMSTTQFGAQKEKDVINRCIECQWDSYKNQCNEYILLELDSLGHPTNRIETHVCEKKIKMSKDKK